MLTIWYICRHMRRRMGRCVVLACIPCVFILLIMDINTSLDAQRLQIQTLYETFQIDGVLVEVKTARDDGLIIEPETIALFVSEDSPIASYVQDVGLKREMWYSLDMGDNPFPRGMEELPKLIGINRLSAALSHRRQPDIAFYSGYDETYLLGDDRVCVASAEMAADLPRGPGGLPRIEMSVKNPYNIGGSGYTQVDFVVIGEHAGEGGALYCPYNTVTALGREMDGAREYASRLTFAIGDNTQLPRFKEAAAAVFSETGQESNHTLRIHDSNFYEVVSAIEKSSGLLKIFQPILFCLCAVIGFMASLLSMRGRKREIVILRCLGLGKTNVFHMAMLEQLILSIFGVAVGIVLYGIVRQVWHLYVAEILICLLCYWTGTMAALAKIVRGDVLAMLKVEE